MRESIHLGRVGRTSIGVSWTLIPIAFLITWGLAGGLPHEVGGYPPALYWVAGLLTAVAFYASLLGHELAHVFVARRKGMQVNGIVLWLFGGMAQIDGDAPDAGSELRLALIGPVTSFLIGGLAAAAAWTVAWLGLSPLAVAALAWLAGINLLLGAFNLVPAFPLDGGRVLRALLWRRSGDKARATYSAARTGRGLGLLMVAFGLFETLSGNLNGLWLAMIGWFISSAATQQMLASRSSGAGVAPGPGPLGGQVIDMASTAAVSGVPSGLTVSEAYDRFFRHSVLTNLPVVDEAGRILGTVTLDGLYAVPGERWWMTPVLEATTPLSNLGWAQPSRSTT
jgi:Zn-dependent protease